MIGLIVLIGVSQIYANPLADSDKQQNKQVANDQLPMADDGSLFLSGGQNCNGITEELHPGALPTCEPTCSNPRPMCSKMFFSGIDFVPCFCKKPLVRNEQTKECVDLSKCPKIQ